MVGQSFDIKYRRCCILPILERTFLSEIVQQLTQLNNKGRQSHRI
jgi:hypothetical protein